MWPCPVVVRTCRKQESNSVGQGDNTFLPFAAALASKTLKHCPQRDQPASSLYFHSLQQTLCAMSLAPDVLDWFEQDNELAGRLHILLIVFLLRFKYFLIYFFFWCLFTQKAERMKALLLNLLLFGLSVAKAVGGYVLQSFGNHLCYLCQR